MSHYKSKENFASFCMYSALMMATVYAGMQMFFKAENNQFYHQYMLEWKNVMLDYQHKGIPYPTLDKQNPAGYMKALSRIISKQDLAGRKPSYVHKLTTDGGDKRQVFLLAHKDTMQIYGLNKDMANSLDKMIDRKENLAAGHWIAFPAKTNETYNAIWFYKKS